MNLSSVLYHPISLPEAKHGKISVQLLGPLVPNLSINYLIQPKCEGHVWAASSTVRQRKTEGLTGVDLAFVELFVEFFLKVHLKVDPFKELLPASPQLCDPTAMESRARTGSAFVKDSALA